jgi:predicted GIY-YIG superfamily endonuclease
LEACPTHLWLGITQDLINEMKEHNERSTKPSN